MAPRSQLQDLLETICPRVYFQPPPSHTMEYPCIVYERQTGTTRYADNKPYSFEQQYEIKLIADEPDTDMFEQLVWLPKSKHSASYVAENLNHDVFAIYF
jgi:hypothetical protein